LDIGRRDGHTEHQAQPVDNGLALLAITGSSALAYPVFTHTPKM
jgi:hypothetical protein